MIVEQKRPRLGLFLMKRNCEMRNEDENERGKMTAEQAMKMLKDENVDVTLEQAGKVLDFLRLLAKVTVLNYLKKKRDEKDSGFICESEYRRTGGKRLLTKKSRGNAKKVL